MPFEGVQQGPTRPPRKGNAAPPTSSGQAPERKLGARGRAREEAANGLGQMIGFGFMVSGQLADAGAVGMHWPNIAHEAALVAESDEAMAKALDSLLQVGPYGNLIVVTLPFVAQILVNHKIVKPEAMSGAGVVHPDALEAQMRTDMARAALQAARMQQEAEQELARVKAEMNGHAQQEDANV